MQRHLWLGILLGALTGCVTIPAGPPEEVAPKIAAALDSGNTEEAEDLFDASAAQQGGSDQLYPLLYEEANTRYKKGASESSARLLRFMADRYPRALAVRESLVCALFLERASKDAPDAELVKSIDAAAKELRKSAAPPTWLGLVEAQVAIDKGEPEAARDAYVAFRKSWDGRPPELAIYVDDIERYLISHP